MYYNVQLVSIGAVQFAEYHSQVKQNINRCLTFTVHHDIKTYGGTDVLDRALQI
jgi:hypothetical protein